MHIDVMTLTKLVLAPTKVRVLFCITFFTDYRKRSIDTFAIFSCFEFAKFVRLEMVGRSDINSLQLKENVRVSKLPCSSRGVDQKQKKTV